MNPFDQNDLIAFHLRELSASRQRALRRELQTNAALAAESRAIAATLRAFPKTETALPVDAATTERTWLALLPSLVVHFPQQPPRFNFLRKWSLPLLAGSALAATAVLVALHHNRHTQPSTVASIGTHSSAVPALASPISSDTALANAAKPNAAKPNSLMPRPRISNRALFPFSAVPGTETEIAKTSPSDFPAEIPAPLPSSGSSSGAVGTAPTEGTASPFSTTVPAQSSAQSPVPSAQPITQPGKSRLRSTLHRPPLTELTLGMFGNITVARSSSYTTSFGTSQITEPDSQAATLAVGALASFRQQLRPWLGYRLTTTYFSPTFEYFNGLDIRHRIYEVSATYVAQGPHYRRLTTSVEAGPSLLNFHYTNDYTYPAPATKTSTLRPAAAVGVGAEYAISNHWGLRAEYRALLYRPPSVADPGDTTIAPSTSLTLSSNPILGITYRFGASGAD